MGLLIYRYEPFWQEVSVKSLILRWPLRPVGFFFVTETNCKWYWYEKKLRTILFVVLWGSERTSLNLALSMEAFSTEALAETETSGRAGQEKVSHRVIQSDRWICSEIIFRPYHFFGVKKLNLQFKRKIEMCQNYNDVIMYCTHKFHYRYTIILFQPLLLSTLSKCLATWPRIDRVWVQIFLAVYELLWLSCINVCPDLVGWL